MNSLPLRYQNQKTEFLLYSIGVNGADDGGDASEPKGKTARPLLDRVETAGLEELRLRLC